MPGPLIRPPTKRQVVIGSIAMVGALGIMALAGSTGHLESDLQKERQAAAAAAAASASPTAQVTAADECRGVVDSLTDAFISVQDALRSAADGGDYSTTDLKAAAETGKNVGSGKDLVACEKADPDTSDTINAGLKAVRDAAAESALSTTAAAGFLPPVGAVLELAQ